MTERLVSQVTLLKPQFKVKALSLALTLLSATLAMPAYALETISDSDLGEATAEGVAFLPENISFRLNAPDGTADTGYIRIIPVGPLTPTAIADTTNGIAGKSDLYLYGAAISESNQPLASGISSADWNGRFGNAINSWGEAKNPWLISVVEQLTPNFAGTVVNLPYINIEAPLYDSTLPVSGSAASSAYNLKLGMWADAFVRDPSKVEGDPSQFCSGGKASGSGAAGCFRKNLSTDANTVVNTLTRENRLRLQAIWDGFSVNGSNIKIFQTLDDGVAGVTTNSTYRTLGLAGLLRLNSGAAASTQAGTYTYTAGGRTQQGYTLTWDGSRQAAAGTKPNFTDGTGSAATPLGTACGNNTGSNTPGNACLIKYQTRATTDTASQSTWTLPAISSVLRISTRETTDTDVIATPALSALGTAAPLFNPNEGLFLYNPNINIVLGQLYQPLILDVAPDNKNLVVEIAAIPNVPNVYKKIYTDYTGADSTYLGSTCNVYQCGTAVGNYQGSTATHSSISIGTVNYSGVGTGSGKNLLTADMGSGAIGVSFGALPTSTTYSTPAQSYRDVQSATRANGGAAFGLFANLPVGQSALFNSAAFSPNTWTQQAALPAPIFATPTQSYPMNNLGSAVIDGMLIQHLKLTTAGL